MSSRHRVGFSDAPTSPADPSKIKHKSVSQQDPDSPAPRHRHVPRGSPVVRTGVPMSPSGASTRSGTDVSSEHSSQSDETGSTSTGSTSHSTDVAAKMRGPKWLQVIPFEVQVILALMIPVAFLVGFSSDVLVTKARERSLVMSPTKPPRTSRTSDMQPNSPPRTSHGQPTSTRCSPSHTTT